MSLELTIVSTLWLYSGISGTFSLHFVQRSFRLERPALKMHECWSRTDVCSWKISANVYLMLDNPFPVLFLCKLKNIKVYFPMNSMKITHKQVLSFRESHIFWSDPRCFGLLNKSEDNIEISIKTAHVSRLYFYLLRLWCYRCFCLYLSERATGGVLWKCCF